MRVSQYNRKKDLQDPISIKELLALRLSESSKSFLFPLSQGDVMKRKIAMCGFLVAAFILNTARADVVFTEGNNPQSNAQNILFSGAGTVAGPAMTVIGRTNQTHTLVSFMSSEMLSTDGMGQSRISAVDGEFRDLSIFLTDGGTFGNLIFNLNTPNRLTGSALITVNLLGGATQIYNFGLDNGQNFLSILATNTDRITRVDINSNTGLTAIDIDDARQVRIGDPLAPAQVPEPATLGLLAAGLIGIQSLSRKRRTSGGA
jgi:hypothetical protein